MALLNIGPKLSPGDDARQKMMLAQALLQNRKPVQHWSDGLSNAANLLAGAYLSRKAAAGMDASRRAKQQALAQALKKAFGDGPAAQSVAMGENAGFPPDGGVPAPAAKPVSGPFSLDTPKAVAGAEAKNELEAAMMRRRAAQGATAVMPQRQAQSQPVLQKANRILTYARQLMQNPQTFDQGYQLFLQTQQRIQQQVAAQQQMQQKIAAERQLMQERMRMKQQTAEQDPRKKFMSVPGLGVYNIETGEIISPYGSAGQGQTDAQTQQGAAGVVPAEPLSVPQGLSPRGREQIAIEEAKAASKEMRDLNKQLSDARKMAEQAKLFLSLMKKQETGGLLLNIPGAKTVANIVGDEELSIMNAITDFLTPLMRQGLPGAASDRDVAIFRGATLDTGKPVEANRVIAQGLIVAAQNKQGELEFKTEYMRRNGHLRGADAAWQRYLEDNRIFVEKPDGGIELNPNRLDWKQYFAGRGSQAPAESGSVQAPQQQREASPPPPPGFSVVE